MATSRLSQFIHGTDHSGRVGQRIVPKKLVLDDVDKVYKYKNTGISDESTERGAFSTDLGSYPDTSLDEDHDQSAVLKYSQSLTTQSTGDNHALQSADTRTRTHPETGTVISIQHEKQSGLNGKEERSNQSKEREAAISALIGAGNIKQYEDFLQSWSSTKDQSEGLAEDEAQPMSSTSTHDRPRVSLPPGSTTVFPNMSSRTKTIEKSPAALTAQQIKSSSDSLAVQHGVPKQPFFRQLRRFPLETSVGPQQGASTSEYASQQKESIHNLEESSLPHEDQIDKTAAEHITSLPAQQILVNKSLNGQLTWTKWKLNRPAELRDVKLDISDQQLLSRQYSMLDEDEKSSKNKDNDTFFTDLDQVVSGVAKQLLDEETLFSHLSQLDQDRWCTLGEGIQSKIGEVTNELKELYAKKKSVALQYEQEIEAKMKQIESNDKVITNKSRKLRSFGARVLNDDLTMKEH